MCGKVHWKTFNPFYPPPFPSLICPPYRIYLKGSPEDGSWNVLYHTSLRNYASFSLQVPSILSILLGLKSYDNKKAWYSARDNCCFMAGSSEAGTCPCLVHRQLTLLNNRKMRMEEFGPEQCIRRTKWGKNGKKSGQPIVRQFGVRSVLKAYSSRQN